MRPTIRAGTICILNGLHDLGIYRGLRPFIDTQVRVVKVCRSGLIELETLDGQRLPSPVALRNLTI